MGSLNDTAKIMPITDSGAIRHLTGRVQQQTVRKTDTCKQ
jgi:hypothetical protein